MPKPDEMTDKAQRDAETIRAWFDELMGPMPIFATRIGYRYDSTPAERRLGEWLMKVQREWVELREADKAEETTAVSGEPGGPVVRSRQPSPAVHGARRKVAPEESQKRALPPRCCRSCWTPYGCGRTWCECHTKTQEDAA